MDPDRVLLFARPPLEGRVKSRLARDLGEKAATTVYRAMLETLLERLAAGPPPGRVEVWSASREGLEALESVVGGRFPIRFQAAGDLGARIGAAFDAGFGVGARRVVVLGSDSPDLPLDRVWGALAALSPGRMVIGPAFDGGYYLVGLAAPAPGVFEEVPWSSGRELDATEDRARARGLEVHRLDPWDDVDDLEDLRRLEERLGAGRTDEPCRRLGALVAEVLAVRPSVRKA